MGYQVLARKWRPHQFRDVVGQSHVLTALSNALDHNRLHHAYLFSGTRGVGKTTIARIFAKGLNCERGVTSDPCDVCSACQEIDQGRFVDLLEIDAASRTKVEDTRDLLDNVQYKPARGRYKIYLIDEVHMLSRHSFNALLKTLEEPPEYVKFILATTDPQKLPVTVLSRCLQFHLKHLDATQIKDQLIHVLAKESVPAQSKALSLIARAAEGSMRDALSLTDQAIALGNGSVVDDLVAQMLGTLSSDQGILLLEALAEGQATPVMQCLEILAEVGVEWDFLLKEVAAQLHRVAMAQALPESVDSSLPEARRILSLAEALSPQDVQLFYQIALQGRQDLPYAPDGRAGLEMVLLRMLAFRPVTRAGFEANTISTPSHAGLSSVSHAALSSANKGSAVTQDKIAALKAQVHSSRVSNVKETPISEAALISLRAASLQTASLQIASPQTALPQIPLISSTPSRSMSPMPLIEEGYFPVDNAQFDDHMPSFDQDAFREYEMQASFSQDQVPFSQDQAPFPQDQTLFLPDQFEGSDAQPYYQPEYQPVFPHQPVQQKSEHSVSPASTFSSSSSSNIRAARNSLRSRVRQQEGTSPKKDKSVSLSETESSVFERVHQKHPASDSMGSNVALIPKKESKPDDAQYRWEPMHAAALVEPLSMTPEKMKLALLHERTDEMREKLEQEACGLDEWSRISYALVLPQLVKQMALNAAMEKQGTQVRLCLRSSQAHLDTIKAKASLEEALSQQFGEVISLSVDVGVQGITPLEWRDKLYTEKLAQASEALRSDSNVRVICQRFSAEIDQDSIRPI